METTAVIAALSALAQDTRLAIFRKLVVAGADGVAAGHLAESLGVAPPTLSFHLKELERTGLVQSRRESRQIFYSAAYGRMRDVLSYLMDDCCQGHPEICCFDTTPKETNDEAPARARRC